MLTNTVLTRSTTIITFDLHGVVSSVDYVRVAQLVIKNPACILKLMLYCFNPWFMCDVYHLWRAHAVAASYLALVKNRYHFLVSCIPVLINVGNAQKRNKPLIAFIKQLKMYGYPVHLFSNIGDIIMDDYIKKYPDVIQLFDILHVTCQKNNYLGKPYDAAFVCYQSECNPMHKQVIFIDNTLRNVEAANRHGMRGIYYTTPSQLVKTVSRLISPESNKKNTCT